MELFVRYVLIQILIGLHVMLVELLPVQAIIMWIQMAVIFALQILLVL
jgi:hypothetical protein